jgi:hypothetical protein
VRGPSAVFPITCPSCGVLLDAIVRPEAAHIEKSDLLTDWKCPRCESRHKQHFDGPLLMVITRYVEPS